MMGHSRYANGRLAKMALLAMFLYEPVLGTWVLILFLIKMGWPVCTLVRRCYFLPLGVCISTLGSKPSRGGSPSCPFRLSVWIGKGPTPSGYRFRTQVICNPLGGGPPLGGSSFPLLLYLVWMAKFFPHPPLIRPDSPPTLLRRLGGSAGSG